MKKLFFIVGIVVAIRLAALLFIESKMLEEPIVIAQTIDYGIDQGYVAYISNKNNPHTVSYIQVGEKYFYPDPLYNNWVYMNGAAHARPYVEGTYHSIYEFVFPLNMINSEEKLEENIEEGVIYFDNGTTKSFPLSIRKYNSNSDIFSFHSSSGSSDGTGGSSMTIKENVTLTKYEAEGVENLEIFVNRKRVSPPVKIEADSSFSIQYKAQPGIYMHDMIMIDFYFTDEQGNEIIQSEMNFKNNRVSPKWIEDVVAGEKR